MPRNWSVGDDRYPGSERLDGGLTGGIVHQNTRCPHQARKVFPPPQRGRRTSEPTPEHFPQLVVAPAQHDRMDSAIADRLSSDEEFPAPPRPGGNQDEGPFPGHTEQIPDVGVVGGCPPPRSIVLFFAAEPTAVQGSVEEFPRHHRTGRTGGHPEGSLDLFRNARVDTEIEVVAGMKPQPVSHEIGEADHGRHREHTFGSQPPDDLRSEMKDRHDGVGSGVRNEAGDGRENRRHERIDIHSSRAGNEESPVDGVVHPGSSAQHGRITGAQQPADTPRQDAQQVDDHRGIAAVGEPTGNFAGNVEVPPAHTR